MERKIRVVDGVGAKGQGMKPKVCCGQEDYIFKVVNQGCKDDLFLHSGKKHQHNPMPVKCLFGKCF